MHNYGSAIIIVLAHQRAYGFIMSTTECIKVTAGNTFLLLAHKTLHFIATFGERVGVPHSQPAVFVTAIIRPNTKDVCGASIVQSAVKPWRMACSLRADICGNYDSHPLLDFSRTNRLLLVHAKQNGVIPSTKEVRVMSARTI